jgi:hypothetical protein
VPVAGAALGEGNVRGAWAERVRCREQLVCELGIMVVDHAVQVHQQRTVSTATRGRHEGQRHRAVREPAAIVSCKTRAPCVSTGDGEEQPASTPTPSATAMNTAGKRLRRGAGSWIAVASAPPLGKASLRSLMTPSFPMRLPPSRSSCR